MSDLTSVQSQKVSIQAFSKSDPITSISKALVKAQTQIGVASKGSENPYFRSKYADYGSVLEACKEALNSNDITILHPIVDGSVQTVLLHSSGEWISSSCKIVTAKPNDPQAVGSAITYARRYGLQALLAIPAEDDDGERAMPPPEQRENSKKKQDAPKNLNEEDLKKKELAALSTEAKQLVEIGFSKEEIRNILGFSFEEIQKKSIDEIKKLRIKIQSEVRNDS